MVACESCDTEIERPYIYGGYEYNENMCRDCFMSELGFDENDMKKHYDEENMCWRPNED